MGAGTGFWAARLRGHGANVLAFDRDPPTDGESNAFFGGGLYADVRPGDASPEVNPERGRSRSRSYSRHAPLAAGDGPSPGASFNPAALPGDPALLVST